MSQYTTTTMPISSTQFTQHPKDEWVWEEFILTENATEMKIGTNNVVHLNFRCGVLPRIPKEADPRFTLFLAHFFPSFTLTFLICSFCLFSLLEQLLGKKLNICFDKAVTHDQLKENKCSVNFLIRSNPVLKVCCNFFQTSIYSF